MLARESGEWQDTTHLTRTMRLSESEVAEVYWQAMQWARQVNAEENAAHIPARDCCPSGSRYLCAKLQSLFTCAPCRVRGNIFLFPAAMLPSWPSAPPGSWRLTD